MHKYELEAAFDLAAQSAQKDFRKIYDTCLWPGLFPETNAYGQLRKLLEKNNQVIFSSLKKALSDLCDD